MSEWAAKTAVIAAKSAIGDGRDVGPNTVSVLVVDLERLREALEWYADPGNYNCAVVNEVSPGAKARAALEAGP